MPSTECHRINILFWLFTIFAFGFFFRSNRNIFPFSSFASVSRPPSPCPATHTYIRKCINLVSWKPETQSLFKSWSWSWTFPLVPKKNTFIFTSKLHRCVYFALCLYLRLMIVFFCFVCWWSNCLEFHVFMNRFIFIFKFWIFKLECIDIWNLQVGKFLISTDHLILYILYPIPSHPIPSNLLSLTLFQKCIFARKKLINTTEKYA